MHGQPKQSSVSGHVFLKEGKRGSVWFAKYRLADSRQVKKKLGPAWTGKGRPPAGYLTEKTAGEALDAILSDARRGILPDGVRSGVTFEDAAAEYLRFVADVRKIGAATVADYRGVINGYLLDEFGPMPIETVTPEKIDSYKERLIGEGKLSARTIVRHLTVLHGIFKRAKRAYGLTENPASADLVERPRVIYTGEFDALDAEQVELLASMVETDTDAAIIKTAAYTGLRQGELIALRWDCVDFVDGLVHVRRNYTNGEEKKPKGKRIRSVPMMPQVIDALARLKDRDHFTGDDDLVFGNDVGGYLDHFELRKRFYAALEVAGLPRIRFHDLRHCFGSAAIKTLDPFAVQSYMGHQHYSTTQRYLHHRPRREDAARIAAGFAPTNDREVDANAGPGNAGTGGGGLEARQSGGVAGEENGRAAGGSVGEAGKADREPASVKRVPKRVSK